MKPTIIGVCGLPCCGKTFILEHLQPKHWGEFFVIDCDKWAKDIVVREAEAVREMMGCQPLVENLNISINS